jgi:hypothetical protein
VIISRSSLSCTCRRTFSGLAQREASSAAHIMQRQAADTCGKCRKLNNGIFMSLAQTAFSVDRQIDVISWYLDHPDIDLTFRAKIQLIPETSRCAWAI